MLKIEKHAKSIKISEDKINDFKGQYIIEPLHRGYGHTLGNALRRVLLSSIPGAAIKAIRIDGVLNEFSVIDGIKEAVSDIILNIKEIVIEADNFGEKRMSLSVQGPKEVTAADIIPDSELKIINPEQVICTITKDQSLDIEFIVDTGEGFVVADEIQKGDWSIDYIKVDAIYTPIRKVSYFVEDTMVGQMTDFDKLTMNIESDGSVNMRDALSYAAKLLEYHISPLLDIGNRMENLREEIIEEVVFEKEETEDEKFSKMRVEELDFSVRSNNCLNKAGIIFVSQLKELKRSDLLDIKNLGKKSLEEILKKMQDLGFDLDEKRTIDEE